MKPNTKTKFGRTHLSMIRAVIAFTLAPENVAITDSVPAMRRLINKLNDLLFEIDERSKKVASPITGYAEEKKGERKKLVETTFTLMAAVKNYAIENDLPVLRDQMDVTRRALTLMSYRDLMATAGAAIGIATPLEPQLTDYVMPGAIAEWVNEYDRLYEVLPNPTLAITERKGDNALIADLMRECMLLLHTQCDGMVYMLKKKYPRYFTGYRFNRKLYPHGHVITKLRAVVQDELEQGIADAQVLVEGVEALSISDMDGACTVNHLPFGNRRVTILYKGVSKTFGPYRFKKGQSQTIYFTMPVENGFAKILEPERMLGG